MAWIYLTIAGLFEIAWAIGLKFTDGWTKVWPSVATILAMLGSVAFLGPAAKVLPIGTAYAVWTGIGATGVAILGMLWFGESRAPLRLLCIAAIVAGIVGLKLAESGT
ncbi:MAG: multidrug efflux SMR transporter [Proteobacteria bacterium]|nr:multidrug efflux SMR transporter [Pseudomonadota bacterium]MBI3497353.1 multidrug efflux SMR transporter [Pseudomonadota bacterium]